MVDHKLIELIPLLPNELVQVLSTPGAAGRDGLLEDVPEVLNWVEVRGAGRPANQRVDAEAVESEHGVLGSVGSGTVLHEDTVAENVSIGLKDVLDVARGVNTSINWKEHQHLNVDPNRTPDLNLGRVSVTGEREDTRSSIKLMTPEDTVTVVVSIKDLLVAEDDTVGVEVAHGAAEVTTVKLVIGRQTWATSSLVSPPAGSLEVTSDSGRRSLDLVLEEQVAGDGGRGREGRDLDSAEDGAFAAATANFFRSSQDLLLLGSQDNQADTDSHRLLLSGGSRGSLFSSGREEILLPQTTDGGSGDLGSRHDLGVGHAGRGFLDDDSALHQGRGIAEVAVHDDPQKEENELESKNERRKVKNSGIESSS